jgi:hypothetical protein
LESDKVSAREGNQLRLIATGIERKSNMSEKVRQPESADGPIDPAGHIGGKSEPADKLKQKDIKPKHDEQGHQVFDPKAVKTGEGEI